MHRSLNASMRSFRSILFAVSHMPTLQSTVEKPLDLAAGELETDVIGQYFALFNLGKFQQISRLFAEDGALYPPFESPVVGREAIATYLIKEADGMQAEPLGAEPKPSDNECVNIMVWGKVTALVFHVKVAWDFTASSKPNLLIRIITATLRVDGQCTERNSK